MGVLHSPDSTFAKEMTKFEAQGSTLGPGLRPYLFRQFPMMMHLAGRLSQGGTGITETRVVDAEQYTSMQAMGFRDTPLEALDAFEAQQLEFAKLAAERAYEVRHTLSQKAGAEVMAAEEAAGAKHLPTIAERPIRRRVRKGAL